jgi:molecular chaperone IbpA
MTKYNMRTLGLPFTPLVYGGVGFDTLIHEVENMFREDSKPSTFPPHNIIKLDDNQYVVELAVAGFKEDEIDITVFERMLTIKGQNKEKDVGEYLYRGIGTRSFIKSIKLMDTIEVKGAEFQDGILTIKLENILPENKKSRKIEITKVLPPGKKELLIE